MTRCVLREVAPGDVQFVPISEVPTLSVDEKIYVGEFRGQRENLGPYGSHRRTICLPVGKPKAYEFCADGGECGDAIAIEFKGGVTHYACPVPEEKAA